MTEQELTACEREIRTHLKSYRVIGNALRCIREGKGYKLRGYPTFDAYCEREFGFVDRHGQRLMAASEVADALEGLFGEFPSNESVAREFVFVAANEQDLRAAVKALQVRGLAISTARAVEVRAAVAACFKAQGLPIRRFGELYPPTGKALTPREFEVLTSVAHGLANKEIARALFISGQTIKNHLSSIYEKLAAKSAAHAVYLVFVEGIGK